MDVRPHPHIGLPPSPICSTAAVHRDTLGSVQEIGPGDVNWMTAGRGIAHSERTAPDVRAAAIACTASRAGSACRRRTRKTAPRFQHVAAAIAG